jgi:hypothetical protein
VSDHDDAFFRTLTKKAAPAFDAVAFFKDAPFAKLLDTRSTKLADDAMSTPLTTPGVKPPKLEVPEPAGAGVDMLQQTGKPKKAPNNPSGFHGGASPGDAGSGFNPLK